MKKPSPTLLGNTEGTALSSGRAWLREATLQRAGEGSLGVLFRAPGRNSTRAASELGGGAGDSVLVQLPHTLAGWLWGRSPGGPAGSSAFDGRVWTVSPSPREPLGCLEQTEQAGAGDHGSRGRGSGSARAQVTWRARGRAGARGGGAWRAPLRWWRGGREGAGPRAGPPWGEAGGREGRSGDGGGGGSGGRGRGAPGS